MDLKTLSFGELLRHYRKMKGLSLQDLAASVKNRVQSKDKFNSHSYFGNMERGINHPPSFEISQILCEILEISSQEKYFFLRRAFESRLFNEKKKDNSLFLNFLESNKSLNDKNIMAANQFRNFSFRDSNKISLFEIGLWTTFKRGIFVGEEIPPFILKIFIEKSQVLNYSVHEIDIYSVGIRFVVEIAVDISIDSFVDQLKRVLEMGIKEKFKLIKENAPKLWDSDYLCFSISSGHEQSIKKYFHQFSILSNYRKQNIKEEVNVTKSSILF